MLVIMLLFPTENLNVQRWSLQISLISLHLLTDLLFCWGGACHLSPGTHYRGCCLCIDCLRCVFLSAAHPGLAPGGEEGTGGVSWVMKEGFKNRQK